MSFSFNISPSNEHSGLIFRIDWLDLLAVQGTLKSILQHQSSKASILLHSAFFIFKLSHPYMTTGKTIALTRQNFVDKVMSLLFNMLSRLVVTFLPRSKCLLISWLQSPSSHTSTVQLNSLLDPESQSYTDLAPSHSSLSGLDLCHNFIVVSYSALTTVIVYQASQKSRIFIFSHSGGWKPKIKEPAWTGSGESSRSGL